jgi:amino acid permease
MMEPVNDYLPLTGVLEHGWIHKNFTLFLVILVVTPATTLTNFTALQNCGAASMTSIMILGTCIVIRSVQCNLSAPHPWYTYVTLWPESPREFLNVIPLYISCFVCHYNILPVHNELQDPTPTRVSWWLRSTTWYAVGLYTIMGLAGSCYGHCTESGTVQGNVLLDFDENDPLLMVGRMCLALTITLAFPMLVIPARDILLRSVILPYLNAEQNHGVPADDTVAQLQEPLLEDEERPPTDDEDASSHGEEAITASFSRRLITSIGIFWTAGLVASCVSSIDIVWDLLGSSLSILLSFLIPSGCYLVIMRDVTGDSRVTRSKALCWILILIFVPLMFVSTGNAVANTFFN